MYKELRPTPSAPEQWDENFASSFRLTGSRLYHQLFRLNRKLFDPLWKVVTDSVRPGDRVLDAGCGLGQWVTLLNEHGVRAAGLDYSERMIATLRQREPHIEWIAGRIQAIPAERESFDAVFSWGVIEHDESGPQAALLECRRILKPGGRLIVTVPIDTPATRRLSEAECPVSPWSTEFYQYFFTPEELRSRPAAPSDRPHDTPRASRRQLAPRRALRRRLRRFSRAAPRGIRAPAGYSRSRAALSPVSRWVRRSSESVPTRSVSFARSRVVTW